MQSQSFKPFVGTHYTDGVNEVPTLVVGASHYCPYIDSCPFSKDCTRLDGPWLHERECPEYEKTVRKHPQYREEYVLSNTTNIELRYGYMVDGDGGARSSYNKFACFSIMKGSYAFLQQMDRERAWNKVAFYEFYPYFPTSMTTPEVKANELQIFCELLEQAMASLPVYPECLILWGKPVREALLKYYPCKLLDSEGYLYYIEIAGRMISVCCLDHPSSSSFYNNKREKLDEALHNSQLLREK